MVERSFKKRHPDTSYDAKYPYNQCVVSEGGHELHFDSTPDKERIRWAHKSGTYREVSNTGRVVEMSVDHKVEYHKGGYTQTTDKNSDVKIGGSDRNNVSGNRHTEIKGSDTSSVSGDVKTIIGGDHVQATKGESVQGFVGDHTLKVGGGSNTKIDGDMKTNIDGTQTHRVGGAVVFESMSKITFKVGGDTIEMNGGNIKIKSARIDLN